MKLIRAVSAICSLAFVLAPASAQPPLSDKVPAEALLYVGWSGRSLTFDGSLFGQLLAEEEVRRFFAGSRVAVADGLGLDEPGRAILDELWAMGGIAWRHPMALGLLDVPRLTRPAGDGAAAPPPKRVGALIVDLQKDRAEFERRFQAMLTSARKKAGISQAVVGKTPYFRFDTRLGPCGMGFVGDMFFLAVGEEAPETVVDLAAGKAKPLSRVPEFVAAMKGVADENAQTAFYVDLARVRKAIEAFGPPSDGGAVPLAVRLDRTLKAVGLDRATAVAAAAGIADRCMYEKVRLFTPAEHRGLLAALSGQALPAAAFSSVPADADLVVAVRQEPPKLLAELLGVLQELDPETKAKCGAALKWAKRKLGLDARKDLLAHLGDQWTLVSAPSLGGFGAGTVLSVTVKDEGKLKAGLDRLAKALNRLIGTPAEKGRPARGYGVARMTTSGGATVHYVSAVGEARPLPVAPAWAVHKGRFYVAAFPQVVAAALDRPEGKGLDQHPDFVALRKRLAAAPSVLVYVNTPHVLDHLYGAALLAWTAGANRATGRGPLAVPPGLLPSLPRLARYARRDICAVTADANGVTVESYGSLPGTGLMFVAAPLHLAAGKVLPRLRRWAEEAPLAESMAGLKAIGDSCRLYAADHKGQFPPELKGLADQGLLKGVAEAHLGACEYLGALMTTHSPQDLLLAYRKPGEGDQAMIVLFVDGNVMRVSLKRFQRDLARTRKYLAEQGK